MPSPVDRQPVSPEPHSSPSPPRTRASSDFSDALDRAQTEFGRHCDDPSWIAEMDRVLHEHRPDPQATSGEVVRVTDWLIKLLEDRAPAVPRGAVVTAWNAAALVLAQDPELRQPPDEPAALWCMSDGDKVDVIVLYDNHALGVVLEASDDDTDAVVPYTAKLHEDVKAALLHHTEDLEASGAELVHPPTRVTTRLPRADASATEVVRAAATAGFTGVPGWPV